ncbi:MAG: hypothetical protein Q4G47_03185 [Lachnospiraceae bacterium]|nr:hypothetical protein [Lachnospiraceae bacterium]
MDEYILLSDTGERSGKISLLCLFTFIYFCRYSFLSFAKSFHISTALVGGLTLILFAVPLFMYTFSDIRHVCIDGILIIGLSYIFFTVTLRVHPEYIDRYLDLYHDGRFSMNMVFSYGAGIYTYYLVRLFSRDGKKLYSLFGQIAYVIVCFDIWIIFFNRTEEYKMGFGYQMEMAALLFLCEYFRESGKLRHCIFSFLCIAAGVLYGSRACILGYVMFILVFAVWRKKTSARPFSIILLGILAVVVSNIQIVMQMVYMFFLRLGLHSRTLYYMAMGNILVADDTARQEKIWPVLIDELRRLPFFKMLGAYGDRTLLAEKWPYAHNFVLEILLTFGKALGGLILIWIVVMFIKTVLYNKDESGLLTIVFGCFSLCKLSVSNTFWQEPYFWAFLAMLVNCAMIRRRRKCAKA